MNSVIFYDKHCTRIPRIKQYYITTVDINIYFYLYSLSYHTCVCFIVSDVFHNISLYSDRLIALILLNGFPSFEFSFWYLPIIVTYQILTWIHWIKHNHQLTNFLFKCIKIQIQNLDNRLIKGHKLHLRLEEKAWYSEKRRHDI